MKNIYILFLALLASGLMTSCEDYLDYSDADHYTSLDQVFYSPDRCKEFINNIYRYMPETFDNNLGINGVLRDCAIDDAEFIEGGAAVQNINQGNWGGANSVDDKWVDYYAGIRAANTYLENGTGLTFDERKYIDTYEAIMAQYVIHEYEARFLRAFYHFGLATRYGDVPLVTKTLSVEEANNAEYRPYNDIIDFVVAECDTMIHHVVEVEVETLVRETIIDENGEEQIIARIVVEKKEVVRGLPNSYNNIGINKETGRATRGAALALKARALLHAASPLNNPEGNVDKWKLAAEAAKDVIDLAEVEGLYALESYENVVNNRFSRDLIFERRNGNTNTFEKQNFPAGFEGGNTGTCPTQNLVDQYQTINGYDVTLTETGWVCDDPDFDANDPYANRDPRLSATILFNGSQWKGKTVECWNGGFNGTQLALGTKTGYYLKKYVREDVNLDPANNTTKEHVWVVFRLADFYLCYAEAMNEAYGPDDAASFSMTAREALNKVRTKAGMPAISDATTTESFREKVIRERRVELAFEDQRFWDIRRWLIGATTQKAIYGCVVTKNSNGTISYKRKLVENRIYSDYYNRYAYPFKESNLGN